MCLTPLEVSDTCCVDPPHDLFDVRLGDLEIDETCGGGYARRQVRRRAAEPKPLARTVDTLDRCALDLERRSRLLQVDDQRPLAAVPLPELGDAAVPGQRA